MPHDACRRRALASAAALLLLWPWLDARPQSATPSRFWPPKTGSDDGRAPVPADRAVSVEGPAARREAGAPGEAVRLYIHDRGSHYEVVAANPLPGPVQVRLGVSGGEGLRAAPAPPVEAVLAAGSERTLLRLYRDGTRPADGPGLDLVQVPGDPRARPRDFPYRLPFEGARVRVDQGFGGRHSHADAANLHALDFALAEGTPVLAAREGVVLEIVAGDPRTGHGIRILHDDGSMAVYAHLQAGGTQVRVGERVRQGQRIALSGNTGYSTAPHLHFAVQVNAGMQLRSIPFRMFADAAELKFARDGTSAP